MQLQYITKDTMQILNKESLYRPEFNQMENQLLRDGYAICNSRFFEEDGHQKVERLFIRRGGQWFKHTHIV